jgi:glycosyltransferase involved in cell wall biosynthesis
MPGRPIRVLFLPRYARVAASARCRFYNYFPYLECAGFRCVASPLFDERYWEKKNRTGRTPPLDALRGYARRLAALAGARHYDLVVVHYEALPYLPAFWEGALARLGVPYVLDFDDAMYHNYDLHPLRPVRWLLGGKFRGLLAGAATVVAGNRHLADYAKAVASRVEIVPTVVDLELYRPVASAPRAGPVVVGWIGSTSTSPYLGGIADALAEFQRRTGARVTLVGSGPVQLPGVDVEVRDWSEAAEVSDIATFDIGIMPLPDTAWASGKSGFKLIQYMALGKPVVASPVGANRDIVEPGVNGFLAAEKGDWVEALERLAQDSVLRVRLGEAGRRKVEREYSLQVTAPRLERILREAAFSLSPDEEARRVRH